MTIDHAGRSPDELVPWQVTEADLLLAWDVLRACTRRADGINDPSVDTLAAAWHAIGRLIVQFVPDATERVSAQLESGPGTFTARPAHAIAAPAPADTAHVSVIDVAPGDRVLLIVDGPIRAGDAEQLRRAWATNPTVLGRSVRVVILRGGGLR